MWANLVMKLFQGLIVLWVGSFPVDRMMSSKSLSVTQDIYTVNYPGAKYQHFKRDFSVPCCTGCKKLHQDTQVL